MNKPTKPPKACSNCTYWSEQQCLDSEGKPILKYDASTNQYVKLEQPYWTYENCNKNWGLPQTAYTSADSCKFFRYKAEVSITN